MINQHSADVGRTFRPERGGQRVDDHDPTSSVTQTEYFHTMAIGDMDTCLHHERNKVVLFCSTCEELICTRCVSQGPASGSRHSGHVYLDLSEAYDIHRVG